jgi:hypothetical protein
MSNRIARVAAAALLSLGLLAQPALAAESKLHVVLQGAPVQFDADPFVENDRTLVPLRTLSEKLGFMVEWDAATQQITLTKFPNKVVLWVGKTEAEANGKRLTLEVAPKIVGNRTFVPLRFISEQLGANVYWNGEKSEIRVTPQGQSDPDALAFLSAKPAATTPAAASNQKAHADLWLKITEPGQKPVEMNMGMNLQAQGQNVVGDIAVTTPMFGANLPVANAQLAIKDGFAWLKLDGGILASQMGTEAKTEWQPLGALTSLATGNRPAPGTTLPPNFNPAELEKLSKEILSQLIVTFGPSEVKDGKKLVRIDVDMSKVDFLRLIGKLVGEEAPADVKLKIDSKMSLLVEEEAKSVRGFKLEAKIDADQSTMELKLDVTLDPATAPITWPADLPAQPPATPDRGSEPLLPPIVPNPGSGA